MTGPAVHVVDDDVAIRDALSWLLRSRGLEARTWESGESFLEHVSGDTRGCAILDVRMDGMSGLEVHEQMFAMVLEIGQKRGLLRGKSRPGLNDAQRMRGGDASGRRAREPFCHVSQVL